MNFSWLNEKKSKTVKHVAAVSSFKPSKLYNTRIRNSAQKRIYNHIKNSIEKKRIQNTETALNIESLTSTFKMMNTINYSVDNKNILNNIENKKYISNNDEISLIKRKLFCVKQLVIIKIIQRKK